MDADLPTVRDVELSHRYGARPILERRFLLSLTVTRAVTKAERFKRMREVERQVDRLVQKGWNVKQIIYDDESGCDFHAMITLTTDGKDERDGVI